MLMLILRSISQLELASEQIKRKRDVVRDMWRVLERSFIISNEVAF